MAGAEALSANEPFADPLTERLAAFLRQIGIDVRRARLGADMPCPGLAVGAGVLLVDELRLLWPGDLLHEAGHIAVADPTTRQTLDAVRDDPGEEMAALAWSYAAARALGLDAEVVFHAGGYRGGGRHLAKVFDDGETLGTPMLEWFGMTLGPKTAAARAEPPFPHMLRWLR